MAHIVKQLTIIGGKHFVIIFVIVLVFRLDFVRGITTGSKNDTELNKGEFKRSFADYSESRKPFDGRRAAEDKISFYQQSSEDSQERSRTFFKGKQDHQASGLGHTIRGYGYYRPPEDPGYGYQVQEQSYSGGSAGQGQNDDHDPGNYNYQQVYHGYQGNDNKDQGYDNRDYVYDHRDQVYEHKGPVYHGYAGPPQHGHDHGVLALKGILLPLAGVALLGAAAALVSNPVLLQLGVISGKRKKRSTSIKDIFKADQAKEQSFESKPAILGDALLDQGRNGLDIFGHYDSTGKNLRRERKDGPLQSKGDDGRLVKHIRPMRQVGED